MKFKNYIFYSLWIWLLFFTTSVLANPVCIPHHAGEGDWPSNTVYAVDHALEAGYKTINITLELSKDKVPFAFHGFKLEAFTNGKGSPEGLTIAQLKILDDAYLFDPENSFPLRGKGIKVATFQEILAATATKNITLIVDLKSKNNPALVNAIRKIVASDPTVLKRLVFYSTDPNALRLLDSFTNAIFVDRPTTFKLLLSRQFNDDTITKLKAKNWIGFELNQELSVCESFTLGQNCASLTKQMWDQAIINKIKQINPNIKIVLFAIDNPKDYELAQQLKGIYGIYTNSPTQICK